MKIILFQFLTLQKCVLEISSHQVMKYFSFSRSSLFIFFSFLLLFLPHCLPELGYLPFIFALSLFSAFVRQVALHAPPFHGNPTTRVPTKWFACYKNTKTCKLLEIFENQGPGPRTTIVP